jgi:hypothetical protein
MRVITTFRYQPLYPVPGLLSTGLSRPTVLQDDIPALLAGTSVV